MIQFIKPKLTISDCVEESKKQMELSPDIVTLNIPHNSHVQKLLHDHNERLLVLRPGSSFTKEFLIMNILEHLQVIYDLPQIVYKLTLSSPDFPKELK